MAGRLDRFLNLEGARSDASKDDPFAEPSGALQEDPAAVLLEQRKAQLASGLDVDDQWDAEQHFVRCGQCGTDSNRTTLRCPTCAADLTTPLQRAFNQALSKKKRAAEEAEAAAKIASEAERIARSEEIPIARRQQAAIAHGEHASLAPDGASLSAQQRAMGEAIAREVKEREADRLVWMRESQSAERIRPFGLRLLDAIPSARWRALAVMGLVSIGGSLLWQALFAHQGRNPLLIFPLIALVALFVPRRRSSDFDSFD